MFEPPTDRCPVHDMQVLLAENQSDCAERQKCDRGDGCPLRNEFAQPDFYSRRPGGTGSSG